MTLFVMVALDDALVREVEAFLTEESAQAAERAWLLERGLLDEAAREHAADRGTRIAVWECNLSP